ncbi:hypothetical protein ACX817_000753 [Staphylococcus pseudintermedius]|nr:hypothetical protein [Staphylococcus pseudintermedius]
MPKSAKDKIGKDVIISYEDTGKGLKLMVNDVSKATQIRGWKGVLGGFGVGGVIDAIAGDISGAAASCL